jgi:Type IV secretion system pilin
MMKNLLKYTYAAGFVSAATMFASTAHADQIGSGITATGNIKSNNGSNLSTFKTYIANILTVITYLAGVLAVFYLIYSGIQYITSAGNPDKVKLARQGIINAVIGIVVITATFFIINFSIGLGTAGQSVVNTGF